MHVAGGFEELARVEVLELVLGLANVELVLLLANLFEVLNGVLWSTKLGENLGSVLNLLIPVILHLEDLLPDRQGNELRVAPKDKQMVFDFDLISSECLLLSLLIPIIVVVLTLL